MRLLTTTGYKYIEDCNIGEELVAYDVSDGSVIVNELLEKRWMSSEMFEDVYSEPQHLVDENGEFAFDQEGNPVMSQPVLLKTKKQVFEETYGELSAYRINDTWDLYWGQSIWANLNVVHAQDLQVGDTIYDDSDNDVTVTSIEKIDVNGWWRLSVSGDHSYISDGLTLHNASRYWVGGGSSSNWNATGNTNWGSVSGGANNASVPSSVDDVTFDGAGATGNTNSTISAGISILSLNITTGYTATMTHNAALSIAGNWTYTGGYTIAGTSSVSITATSTITSNGVAWPNAFVLGTNGIITLAGDLSISGSLSNGNGPTINGNQLILAGGIGIGYSLSGTTKIILKGGSWSTANVATINNNLDIDGNITLVGSVYYNTGTMTYVSGTVTVTGSTLNIQGSCVLNTNGINWNNLATNGNGKTITLTSNLTIAGVFTNLNATINRTLSETVTCSGGITISGGCSGTAKFILTGGTWTGSSNSTTRISNPVDINGNITLSSVTSPGYGANVLTYVSGTVTTAGSTLNIVNGTTTTLNTGGMTWNNIYCYNTIVSLGENLILSGSLGTDGATWNAVSTQTITTNGLTVYTVSDTSGTAAIILTGGTWSGAGVLRNSLVISGSVTVSGTVNYRSGELKYQSGTVTTTGSTLNITNTCTLNTNGITWNNVRFAAATVTTLTSNLSMSGLLSTATPSGNPTINSTTSETVTTSGGMTIASGTYEGLIGTAKIILTGGTWTATSLGTVTNSIEFNGNVTINGTVYKSANTLTYVSGTVTTTNSTLVIGASTTLNTNGIAWNNVTTQGGTYTLTLTSNFLINGFWSNAGALTINRTTTETWTVGGGITYAASFSTGTAEIYVTGGTLSSTNLAFSGCTNKLYINGNITIGTFFRVSSITYISGTVTTTGSTVTLNGPIDSAPIVWNNINLIGTTYSLSTDLYVNGLLSVSNATVNKVSNQKIYANGGLLIASDYGFSSTADVYLQGGTWSHSAGVTFGTSVPLFINGDVTLRDNVYISGGTITYLSGSVNTAGSNLIIRNTSNWNTNGMTWGNVTFGISGATHTLISDFSMSGLLTVSIGSTLNTATSSVINVAGGLLMNNTLAGTAKIVLTGGTLSGSSALSNNLDINGNVTISGTISKAGGVMQILSGLVKSDNARLILTTSTSVLGFNKVPLLSVTVQQATTLTIDKMFTGTPTRACQVQSSSTTNYNIQFTDGFEKVAKFVNITNATVSRSNQLLVLTSQKFNTNRSTNAQGIRYYNQSPNGFSKNAPSISDTMTAPTLGLVSDPNFVM